MDFSHPFLACLMALGVGVPMIALWMQANAGCAGPKPSMRDALDAQMDRARAIKERLDATYAWRQAHIDGQDTEVDRFLDALADAVFVRRGFTPVPHSTTDSPGSDALRNGVFYMSWGIDQLDEDRPKRVFLHIWDSTSFHRQQVKALQVKRGAAGTIVLPRTAFHPHDLPAWLGTAIATRAVHHGVPVSGAGFNRRRFAMPQPVSHHQKLATYAALQPMLPPGVSVDQAIDDIENLCQEPV